MSIDRRPAERFDKGEETALKSAVIQLHWVLEHLVELRTLRNGDKAAQYAVVLKNKIDAGEELEEWQYNEIDNLYEKTMKALGFPSITKHFDRPRGNLRHPK